MVEQIVKTVDVLRVLVIENNEANTSLIVAELERAGYKVFFQQVKSKEEFETALDTQTWDVIFADCNLPKYGALPALATLKAAGIDIPFLIVSDSITEEMAVMVMKAGAVDYILRDRLSRLPLAVSREIKEARMRGEISRERLELSRMEARYRAVFETSGAAIVLVEEDGLLTLVNKQFARLTGYDRSEIQGKMNWRDFVTDAEERYMLEISSQMMPLFRQRTYDTVVVDKKGVIHNVIITVSPLPETLGSVASLLDVTAGVRVQQVEAALKDTESMFQTFLDNIGVGIAVFSPERRILSVNKKYAEWYPEIDFFKQPFCREWCEHMPDENFCLICPLLQSLSGGVQNVLQTIKQTVHEKTRYYRLKTAPVRDASGIVNAVIELREDVTEQIVAQNQLRKLSAAVEQSPGPVIIMDVHGYIEYVNPKFTQLTGYSQSEVIGKRPSILTSEEADAAQYEQVCDIISRGEEFRCEFHNKTKTGEHYWSLSAISPIRDADNQITHYLEVQQNITERKKMETQLRENNEQLAEALQQLKQIQSRLIQQEKLAGIGQLAAGVAHEINNPLGFVSSNFNTLKKYLVRLQEILAAYQNLFSGISSLAKEELMAEVDAIQQMEKDKKLQRLLADLPELLLESEDGLERVGEIVKSLRLFSRLDVAGSFSWYDLNSGLESTLLVARNEIKYYADVITELGEIPQIEAVGSEINQVLLNILVNAAQAIREKSEEIKGEIHIITRFAGDSVYCSISDTGSGISEEYKSRIFEPFFTTKDVGKGTGLGLSISYDIIVNKHGGDISVESILGEGTIFTLRLPVYQPKQRENNGNNTEA